MGDVVELDQLAQFECGVDRNVAEPPARIRLEPVAGLGEIVASAEIAERFDGPFLHEAFEVTAAAFERGLTCRKAARAQHCREDPLLRRATGMQRLGHGAETAASSIRCPA